MITQNATSISNENDPIRACILRYLYDRNANATSARGKRGAAVKIMDLRRDVKAQHGLTGKQVIANLTYLISQGWVDKQTHARVVPTSGGQQIPSTTDYFIITASGIDKVEGTSDFTPRDRFAGIVNIHAAGQSTVTVGDGNQVNTKYAEHGEALAELSAAIKESRELDVQRQMNAVSDIDSIQAQLARSQPDVNTLKSAWKSILPLVEYASLANRILSVAEKLRPWLFD